MAKIEFVKHQILENDPWWFELGISCQTIDWNRNKYLFAISLCFWSIYIRWGSKR